MQEEPRVTDGLNDWDINLDEPHPTAADVIDRLDRAAILARRDPLRKGNVVHLPQIGRAHV